MLIYPFYANKYLITRISSIRLQHVLFIVRWTSNASKDVLELYKRWAIMNITFTLNIGNVFSSAQRSFENNRSYP